MNQVGTFDFKATGVNLSGHLLNDDIHERRLAHAPLPLCRLGGPQLRFIRATFNYRDARSKAGQMINPQRDLGRARGSKVFRRRSLG